MRYFIAALLLWATAAHAASYEANVGARHNFVVAKATGTTGLYFGLIDTVVIDCRDMDIDLDTSTQEMEFKFYVQPLLDAGDSCTVNYDVSADGTHWAVALGSQAYVGTTPDEEELSSWGQYVRMRVLATDTTTDSLITPSFHILAHRGR